MKMHNTKSGDIRILEVRHPWSEQDAIHPVGSGRGIINVLAGHPQAQKVILELLKLDIVGRVIIGKDYIMVTVTQRHRWNEVEGEICHIVARCLENHP